MKLVRFLQRSFVMGRIVESGESILMPDDHPMSLHMIDVARESAAANGGDPYEPEGTERVSVSAVYRSDLANDIVASGAMHGRTTSGQVDPEILKTIQTEDGRTMTWDAEARVYRFPHDPEPSAPAALEPATDTAPEAGPGDHSAEDGPVDAPADPAEAAPTEG